MKGMIIFDIKRYALHDGPGIRTTLFFKGCPLRCVWCHNPESWLEAPQKTYKKSKCIGCRSCVDACPHQALALTADGIRPMEGSPCTSCGRCTEECPSLALEMCGREWSMAELMAEVEKEREMMERSGGGVTLCGGEPLMQAEAAWAVLDELGRRGFHRAVDTTLYAPEEVVRKTAERCELFLVDLKVMDDKKHKQYTGVSNQLILDHIRLLAEMGKPFYIRIPLIEGVNADEENLRQTTDFLKGLEWKEQRVDLLPYHDVGKDKHQRIWSHYNPQQYLMSAPLEEQLQNARDIFIEAGLQTVIGG